VDEHPRPDLVNEAIAGLRSWGIEPTSDTWRVRASIAWHESILHTIAIGDDDTPGPDLIYKVMLGAPPGAMSESGWFDRHMSLTNRAVLVLRAAGLDAALVLAGSEPDRVIVMEKIAGQTMASQGPPRPRLDPSSQRTLEDIGRGARLIEETHWRVEAQQVVTEQMWSRFERRVGRARLGHDLASRVTRAGRAHFDRAHRSSQGYALVHGDLSLSNILISPDRVGFIDFGWMERFPGFDVLKVVHRLETARPFRPDASREAVRSVLEGYGAPVDEDAWVFMRMYRALGSLSGHSWRSGLLPVRRQALAELNSHL
jgi:tRNA A-37 threonylcarbamoyl transferase component Bud32